MGKLESQLILKYRSNEDNYGYNTQAIHISNEIPIKNDEIIKKISVNKTDIAKNIIES